MKITILNNKFIIFAKIINDYKKMFSVKQKNFEYIFFIMINTAL